MKTIAIFSTLVAAALAAPSANFNLKVVTEDSRFNGQCVYSYHTGAGTGDAVLGDCSNAGKPYSFSNGVISSNIYGKGTPAGVQANVGIEYDDWYSVTINIGKGSKGFTYSDANGFLTGEHGEESGFIVCKWAHGGNAQLFVLDYARTAPVLLSNCANVKLVKA